jgi:hypothetical protein
MIFKICLNIRTSRAGVALYRLGDLFRLLDGLQLVDEGRPYAYLYYILLLQQLGQP